MISIKLLLVSKILLIVFTLSFSQVNFSQVTVDTLKTTVPDVVNEIKKIAVTDSIKPVIKPIALSDSLKKVDKLKFGCGVGVNFVGGTNLSLSPNATYSLSKSISLGGGLQASYSALKNIQNTTTFGLNLLGNYNPIKQILTTLEFAQLKVKTTNESTPEKTSRSFWDTALFVGAGYNINSKISIGAKYNMLYKEDKSVYSSAIVPFVNIGF
jgi:Outer membrane protein beta-barrel domain